MTQVAWSAAHDRQFTTGSWAPSTASSCQDHGLALPRRPCRRRQVSWSSPHAKCSRERHTLGLADLREGSALATRPHRLPRPSYTPGRERLGRDGRGVKGVQHACVRKPHARTHTHTYTHTHTHTHAHALLEALPLHPLVLTFAFRCTVLTGLGGGRRNPFLHLPTLVPATARSPFNGRLLLFFCGAASRMSYNSKSATCGEAGAQKENNLELKKKGQKLGKRW